MKHHFATTRYVQRYTISVISLCWAVTLSHCQSQEKRTAPLSASQAPEEGKLNGDSSSDSSSCLGLGPTRSSEISCQMTEAQANANNAQAHLNISGKPLEICSTAPTTGWFRDGYCRTDASDRGSHTVCAEMNQSFLAFTKSKGNDLSSPRPSSRFPGLKPGDRWCLCSARWLEAQEANRAPKVIVSATDRASLRVIKKEQLEAYAAP